MAFAGGIRWWHSLVAFAGGIRWWHSLVTRRLFYDKIELYRRILFLNVGTITVGVV